MMSRSNNLNIIDYLEQLVARKYNHINRKYATNAISYANEILDIASFDRFRISVDSFRDFQTFPVSSRYF